MGFFKLILAFSPWILFKIISGPSMFRLEIGIIVALIISVILALKGIHKGFILLGSILFFSYTLIAVVIMKNVWAIRHIGVLAMGTLAGISWLSILIRRPFTLAYSRSLIDKEQWNSPQLIRRGYLTTGVWAFVFSVNVLINVFRLNHGDISRWIYEAVEYGFFLIAILFTTYYPKWSSARGGKTESPRSS